MTANVERAALVADTVERLRKEPKAAVSSPTATAVMVDGRARISGGPFTWDADLPAALGGQNNAPSPTLYLLGALAGCAAVFIHDTLGPQLGVPVADVRAVATCRADAGGLLGLRESSPALERIELEVGIDSSAADGAVDALRRAWLDRCPVYLALVQPNQVVTRFVRVGGQ